MDPAMEFHDRSKVSSERVTCGSIFSLSFKRMDMNDIYRLNNCRSNTK